MAFPRPFNALASYYDRPPWCPEAVLLAEDIPVRQLKDYLPYYPAEAEAFIHRPMVRWCMDPAEAPFPDLCWPSTEAPDPGYLKIQGQFFSAAAYQVVGLENIMVGGVTPEVIDYLYLLLRQICPDDVVCPPIEVEGGASFALAVELDLGTLYETTLLAGAATTYFHYAGTADLSVYELTTDIANPAGYGSVGIYDGALPIPTLDTTVIADGTNPWTQNGANGTWLAFTPAVGNDMVIQFVAVPQ